MKMETAGRVLSALHFLYRPVVDLSIRCIECSGPFSVLYCNRTATDYTSHKTTSLPRCLPGPPWIKTNIPHTVPYREGPGNRMKERTNSTLQTSCFLVTILVPRNHRTSLGPSTGLGRTESLTPCRPQEQRLWALLHSGHPAPAARRELSASGWTADVWSCGASRPMWWFSVERGDTFTPSSSVRSLRS